MCFGAQTDPLGPMLSFTSTRASTAECRKAAIASTGSHMLSPVVRTPSIRASKVERGHIGTETHRDGDKQKIGIDSNGSADILHFVLAPTFSLDSTRLEPAQELDQVQEDPWGPYRSGDK